MRRYVLVVGQSLSDVSCKCKVTASHISCILHVVLLLYLLKKFYLGIQILYLCRWYWERSNSIWIRRELQFQFPVWKWPWSGARTLPEKEIRFWDTSNGAGQYVLNSKKICNILINEILYVIIYIYIWFFRIFIYYTLLYNLSFFRKIAPLPLWSRLDSESNW